MNMQPLRTRRMLLRDMGKAGLAVMVLGVAACSEDAVGGSTTTGSSGTATATPPSLPTPSTTITTTTDTTTQTPTPSEWHRATLGTVSAYIIYRNGEAALVDTGNQRSEEAIEAALGVVGLSWDSVGHVIVTHQHGDHQGSLGEVLRLTDEVPWYAGSADIPAIAASTEGIVVGDGDSVFDLEVIETPGHTLGHISLLDRTAGVLVTGDALFGSDGGVTGSIPQYTTDMGLANASVAKLAAFDYDVALFGHGDPILNEASGAVGALAENLGS